MRVALTHVALLVLLVLAACESSDPNVRRRDEFFSAHPDTSPEVRQTILDGEIRLGMTYPEVIASLGRYDSTGPAVSDLGDYHVRLYDTRVLAFEGAEIEDSVLVITSDWGSDPAFRRLRDRIRSHRARQ